MLGLGLSSWQAAARIRGGPQAMLGPALLGFWDAERVDRMTLAGSNVTSWTDLINGYTVSQATSGFKPLWESTSFGGRPGVRFDGTDDYLEMAPSPLPSGSAPYEVWALVTQTALAADAGSKMAFSSGGTSGALSRRVLRAPSAGVNRASITVPDGTSFATVRDDVTDFSGGPFICRSVFADGASALQVNGGTPVTGTGTLAGTTSNRLRFGASSPTTASNFWQGLISAILVTDPLSAAQAAQLTRWGKDRGAIA